MATYNLTPSERRARAQTLKEQRENRYLYSNYLAQKQDVEKQAEQKRLNAIFDKNEKESQNFFTRGISTIGDIASNVITGAAKGLEGIYDLGASLVGAVGGIFDKDFQNSVKSHVAYDWTSETIGNPLQELTKYSYTKDGGIIEGVASGIGQMLPAVAISLATAGIGSAAGVVAGAASKTAQVASIATLGVSAAGNSTEEAFNEGADYYKGLGYGLASGAVEVATEKMFGGVTKSLFGKGMLDNVGKSVADTGIKRIAKNALEEGVEEVVSELANPALKGIYKGGEAFEKYKTADYWKGVAKAGAIGSLTALAYSGTVGYGMSKVGMGYVGKEADINDSLTEIKTQKQKADNLFANEKLTEKNEATITSNLKGNYQNIETALKNASETKRADMIKKFSLESAFETDGSMKADFASKIGLIENVEQVSEDTTQDGSKPLASLDKRYYTPSLRGSEQTIQEDLGKITANLQESENNIALEEGREAQQISFVTPYTGELSDTGKASFTKVKKGLNYLNGKSGGKVNIVIVNPHESFNGNLYNDKTIYLGADTLENGKWAGTLVHEYTHFAEGSKDYNKLIKFIRGDAQLFETAAQATAKAGYFSTESLDTIIGKIEAGKGLTVDEARAYGTFQSEINAHMTETLLGNEAFIGKIVRGDITIAEKVLNKINDLKAMFKSFDSKESRAEYKELEKAERLYLKAVESAGYKYFNRKIIRTKRDEVDAEGEMQYNRKAFSFQHKNFPGEKETGSEAHRLAIWWTKQPNVESGDQTLISMNDRWYLVERFDDTDNGYQVEDYITKTEYNKIFEEIKRNGRSGQIKSIQRAFTDYGQFDKRSNAVGGEESSANSIQTQHDTENSKVLRVDKVQSQRRETSSNGDGNSKSSGKNKQGIKYFLKDKNVFKSVSQIKKYYDNAISEAYQKYREVDPFGVGRYADDQESIKAFNVYNEQYHQLEKEKNEAIETFTKKNSLSENSYLSDDIEEEVLEKYGKTYNWRETGYILTDGSRLDLSGKKDGGRGGYRAIDHRDIFEDYDMDGTEAMVEFMALGNIRVSPENPGINLQIEPNEEQYRLIQDMVERLGWNDEYFSVDFDNEKGGTVSSLSYEGKVSARKVIADIKYYFKEGKSPQQSELSKFRYSLKPVEPIKPTSESWTATISTDEALKRFPNLWNVKAEASEVRNPTQIKGTVSTYRKVFDILKDEGFNGKILDASSGLGYGTKAGIEEYGFNVEDIEPYPDSKYKPKYIDYASLKERYEVIISNAVLNVLPQDQRDALVIKMGELLKKGGRLFVNVRGDDVNSLSSNPNNVKIGDNEWYVAPTGSYQKGFTKNELVAYLKDALGKDFMVKPTSLFGKTSAIATKIADTVKFSRKDSEGNLLNDKQVEFFQESKAVDGNGNLQVVYHGTMNGNFTVFDVSKASAESDMGAGFYFSSSNEDVGSNYEHGGEDLTAKIERLAERIESDEDIDYDEAKVRAEKQLKKGSKLFEVYLNIKNPAYVGGNFDSATCLMSNFQENWNMEDFDSEEEYYEQIDQDIQDFVDEVIWAVDNEGISDYDGLQDILHEACNEGGITINDLKEKLNNSMFAVNENGDIATNEVLRIVIEKLGYDGIIDNSVVDKFGYNSRRNNHMEGIDEETRHYIVFKPEQIKLIDNQNPTESVDIRYSKKEGKKYYKLTEGQLKKIIANNTKYKTYTLADSEAIINNVLSQYMSFGDKYGELSGKTKNQVIDMLWNGLNSADPDFQMNVALNIADYIIQNGVLENIYGDADFAWAVDTIYILKPYLHSLDLNGIKGEIKYKYDTDNSPYLLWGKRRGSSGIVPDQLGQLLEETGLQIDAINEADIFIQVDDLYRSAVKALKKKAKSFLSEGLSSEEQKTLRQEIAREVLRGYDYTGGDSKLAGIVNKYTDRIRVLKEQLQDEKVRNSVINRLLDKTQKLKDLKLGTFLNATEFKSDIFKGSIEKLAAIKFRGDLNQSGTRDIVKGLAEWYVESNEIVGEAYEKEISETLNEISNGKGKFTTQELHNLTNIVDYFKHFVETYNKVFRNGQYVEAQPIAESYIQTLRENKAINVGWFKKQNGSAYVKIFGDPMSVARRMDMYESGFYTEMIERLRESTINAAVDEMDIRAELDEFLTKNKKYLKEATKRKVQYLGNDIPLMEALYVYMALGRKQAQLGLEKSGFTFTQDKETIRVNGFDTEGKTAESTQNDILKQLNETDKKFIEIAKKIFNEECKDRKRKTDIARRGYSNVSEDEYIPIRRANVAKSVDTSTFKEEMDRVSNASFNKDTVQWAAQELIVEPLNEVLDRHIHAVAQYTNLATTIDEYNKLFSLDISGNKNKPVSVATESQNTWNDGNEYFKKLISDIQGVPTSNGVGNRAMSFVRGNYAKYQLGFNPKVWLTQLSSFAAAGSILDVKSIIQGLGVSSKDIDEYSALTKLRNKDNTAAMAQGVLSKPNKVNLTALNDFSDLLMKPIGVVDRFVVKKLFGACQVQVEKESGLKIGTAENKQKAAELLNMVILETQQNSMATERSAAMRSGSEFMKTITMFSADAMKVVGRVIDSIGELTTLQARKKAATDSTKVAELEKHIKAAQKKTAKSVASLVTSAVLMALIAQLFRTLYNKDDEEDNIAQNMAIDAIGNLLGGLPIIRDIYSRFTQGYEIDGYAYSALNDLLDTGVGIFDTVGDIFSGKANLKDIALNIKKLTYAGGQILGLPTRNVYNIVYGLTKRFSPSAAYKIDDMLYKQSYSTDLKKAIENEDDSMIATITGIMLNENVGGIKEASVREEMNSLVSNGFSVLPRSIGDKITYEGEEIILTNKQKEQFKTVYSEANSKVASLLNLSQYKSATEEVRAKAIKYIYDIYYNLALEDLLGVDLENKNLLFAEAIDIEKLAIIIASARELLADTDKNGKTVSGSKKAKVQAYVKALQLSAVQKYMIMGYLGYANAKGENQVKGYIQRLSLSKTQKQQLFEYSGYAA